ncbi:hypothetical protein ACHAW6_004212 [Cyclotella cf. meneghiniana]
MGVYGKAIIKKWVYNKELGNGKTSVQSIENQTFLFHFHKDDRYECKIMNTHGLMLPADHHVTNRYVNGEWISFKCCELMFQHNHSKH